MFTYKVRRVSTQETRTYFLGNRWSSWYTFKKGRLADFENKVHEKRKKNAKLVPWLMLTNQHTTDVLATLW